MTCSSLRKTEMAEPTIDDFENSLRILARIIARAYLNDLGVNQNGETYKAGSEKEESNAD